MREKRVLRYYCDFCKKSLSEKSKMADHEANCTYNPNRNCWMCDLLRQKTPKPASLIPLLNPDEPEESLERLQDATNNCPNCMSAAIRQSEFSEQDFGFDYNQARDKFNDRTADSF